MTTVEGMTHSQEPRVSSSQDSLRLSEESISMLGVSTNSTKRLLHLSEDCGCNSQSARHLSNHSVISSSNPNVASNLSIPQGVTALVNKLNSCTTSAGDGTDDEKSAKEAESSSQKDKLEETFPWLRHFGYLCRKAVGTKSIKCLENLLTVYLQHVTKNVKDCYMKPNRAFKLKKCMNEALVFFHMFYQDIREPFEHAFYLSKMTDLVAMYLDMEIKASRRRKETIKRVASRLISSLYILLDKSEDHMMEAILKTTLINKGNRELCAPILGKLLTALPITSANDSYVRFVLAFKLWKKIVSDLEERRRITRLADQRLTAPSNFDKSKRYNDVLPRIPKSKKNITVFYMQAKFNLKEACVAFLKLGKTEEPLLDTGEMSEKTAGKPDEVGGVRSMNLFNSLWSIINVSDSGLVETSQLNKVTGEKAKANSVASKKGKLDKKSKKAKKKAQKEGSEVTDGKAKKKKKVNKKKTLPNSGAAAESVLGTILSSKNAKEQKKKKKKVVEVSSPVVEITPPKETSSPAATISVPLEVPPPTLMPQAVECNQEALSSTDNQVVVKAEIGQDLCIVAVVGEAGRDPEQGSNQVNQINSVSYFGENTMIDMKENLEDSLQTPIQTSAPAMVVEVETNECVAVPANQVNQVNSVSMETESAEVTLSDEVVNNDLGLAEKLRICDTPQVVSSDRMTPEQMNQVNSSKETPPPKDVNVCNVEKSTNAVSKSNVIASSSDSPVVNFLLNASQTKNAAAAAAAAAAASAAAVAAATTATVVSSEASAAMVENEAIPTVVNMEAPDKPSTDETRCKVVEQPPAETITSQEANVAASSEVICDSSVRPEVPIPEEGSAGVDNDYFNSLPMEYDSDVEILADLRPQVTGQHNRSTEVVVKDERDACQDPSSVLDNIFATENEALVTEVLGGLYPVTAIDLENRTVRCESNSPGISGLPSPSLCDDEGTEVESPPVERFNEADKLSMNLMMHQFIKEGNTYSLLNPYERERQYVHDVHDDQLLLYRDTLLSENSISRYDLNHSTALPQHRFMEDDDTDDGSCYDESYNSSGSSGRLRMGGGKVGFHNYTSALNDKDLPDVSPTSSVESAVLNNACIETRESSYIASMDQSPQQRPRIGQKIPAPGLSRMSPFPSGTPTVTLTPISQTVVSTTSSPSTSPTKRFSDVNTSRYYTPSLVVNDKQEIHKKPSRLPASDGGRNEMETRNTKERYNQQKSSSAGSFPDVVLDAHKSSEKQDKEVSTPGVPHKPRGRGRGRGRGGSSSGRGRGRTRSAALQDKATIKSPPVHRITRRQCAASNHSKARLSSSSDDEDVQPKAKRSKDDPGNRRPHTRSVTELGIQTVDYQQALSGRKRR